MFVCMSVCMYKVKITKKKIIVCYCVVYRDGFPCIVQDEAMNI